jgi:hypothetical protein
MAAVNFLLDEPRIKAISFVGSDHVGRHIWERGTKNGKRVQVRNRLCYHHSSRFRELVALLLCLCFSCLSTPRTVTPRMQELAC